MSRSQHHTGWAGALAVAAALSRRSYDVSITLGNTPALDLLCSSPSGEPFKVQVKSLTSPNWVLIRKDMLEGPPHRSLFFVIVLVPSDHIAPFEFHVLTHDEVCALYTQLPKVKRDGQPYKPGMDGLAWGQVKAYRDAWAKLPE